MTDVKPDACQSSGGVMMAQADTAVCVRVIAVSPLLLEVSFT